MSVQGRGFHGHYASFDLKDRRGMFHINMEKFGDIHDQLVSEIATLAATPASDGGEAIPLRMTFRPLPRSNYGTAACGSRLTPAIRYQLWRRS